MGSDALHQACVRTCTQGELRSTEDDSGVFSACYSLLSTPRSHLRTEDCEAPYTTSKTRLHGRSDAPTAHWQRVLAGVTQGRHGFLERRLPPLRGPHPGGFFPMVHGQFCLPQQRQVIARPSIQSLALQPPWLQPGNFQPGTGLPGGPHQYLGDPAYRPPRGDPLVSLLYQIPPSPPSSSIWLIKRKPRLEPGQLMLCGQRQVFTPGGVQMVFN